MRNLVEQLPGGVFGADEVSFAKSRRARVVVWRPAAGTTCLLIRAFRNRYWIAKTTTGRTTIGRTWAVSVSRLPQGHWPGEWSHA